MFTLTPLPPSTIATNTTNTTAATTSSASVLCGSYATYYMVLIFGLLSLAIILLFILAVVIWHRSRARTDALMDLMEDMALELEQLTHEAEYILTFMAWEREELRKHHEKKRLQRRLNRKYKSSEILVEEPDDRSYISSSIAKTRIFGTGSKPTAAANLSNTTSPKPPDTVVDVNFRNGGNISCLRAPPPTPKDLIKDAKILEQIQECKRDILIFFGLEKGQLSRQDIDSSKSDKNYKKRKSSKNSAAQKCSPIKHTESNKGESSLSITQNSFPSFSKTQETEMEEFHDIPSDELRMKQLRLLDRHPRRKSTGNKKGGVASSLVRNHFEMIHLRTKQLPFKKPPKQPTPKKPATVGLPKTNKMLARKPQDPRRRTSQVKLPQLIVSKKSPHHNVQPNADNDSANSRGNVIKAKN